jgi:GNAT superfamily N-acetyltransferase
MEIRPVTGEDLTDLTRLFDSSGVLSGCWCMFFLLSGKEFGAGWGATNQARFAELAAATPEPMGLLAYRQGAPVGWCAAGPRARYGRILRSPLLKGRDVAEDATVWVVPCFFVRREARRTGVTRALLRAAVDLAAEHGATAVEGLPLAAGGRHPSAEAYVGTEDVFAACGFQPTSRPSPRRLVMRRALSPRRRSVRGTGARTGR